MHPQHRSYFVEVGKPKVALCDLTYNSFNDFVFSKIKLKIPQLQTWEVAVDREKQLIRNKKSN